MEKLWKRIMFMTLIGAVMGFVVCFIITLLTSDSHDSEVGVGMMILYYSAGIMQGAIAMGGTVVYQIERWSITKATVTHFVLTFAGYIAMGYIQGWLDPGAPGFWITTAVMIVCYIIIWLANYYSCKNSIKEINDKLDKLNGKKVS